MNALEIAAERAPVRRRIVILNSDFRILRTQLGSMLDDRIFGFGARDQTLPPQLQNVIRGAGCAATLVIANNILLRIFPFVERDEMRIGLIFERMRRRSTDVSPI
jgi:hypothetical protein